MGGISLIFTPVLVTHLLGHPGLSGPMTGISRTHGASKQSCWQLRIQIQVILDPTGDVCYAVDHDVCNQ